MFFSFKYSYSFFYHFNDIFYIILLYDLISSIPLSCSGCTSILSRQVMGTQSWKSSQHKNTSWIDYSIWVNTSYKYYKLFCRRFSYPHAH